MKIRCPCGHEIADTTDDLPHKGHLIPDQAWFPTLEALDGVIEDAAGGRSAPEQACQRAREVVGRAARLAWQCRHCGRLYIDGGDHQLRCFRPESEPVDREVLRGGSG